MFDAYSTLQLAVTAAIVFFAFLVRGMSGFGSSLIAMPFLVFVLPIHTAVPMMALLVLILFVFLTLRDWRDVIWRELILLVVPTFFGIAGGLYLFAVLDHTLLIKLLGGFIGGYGFYVLAVHYVGLPPVRCSEKWALPAGFLGAAADTLFGGGGGAVIVVYMHLRQVNKTQFRATTVMLWFFEMIMRVLGYGVSGYYTMGTLALVALMLPAIFAGTYAGEKIHHRISQETFSRLLAVLLILSGATLLFK